MRQMFLNGFVTNEPQVKVSQKTGVEYLEFGIGSQEFGEQAPIFFTVRVTNDRLKGVTRTLKKGGRIVLSGEYSDSAYCKDGNALVGRYITANSIDYVQSINGGQKGNGGQKQGNKQGYQNNYQQGGGQQYQQNQGYAQQQSYQAPPQQQYMEQPAQMQQSYQQPPVPTMDNELPF